MLSCEWFLVVSRAQNPQAVACAQAPQLLVVAQAPAYFSRHIRAPPAGINLAGIIKFYKVKKKRREGWGEGGKSAWKSEKCSEKCSDKSARREKVKSIGMCPLNNPLWTLVGCRRPPER